MKIFKLIQKNAKKILNFHLQNFLLSSLVLAFRTSPSFSSELLMYGQARGKDLFSSELIKTYNF